MKVYRITLMIERWIWQLKKLLYLRRMKFLFKDNGDVIDAFDDQELVTKMRLNSHDRSENNKDYMLNYVRRAVISNDEDIRATNETEFVNDLLRLQHIELI